MERWEWIRWLAVVLIGLGAAHPAIARPEAALPSAERIFEKYARAVGGREAVGRLTTRRMKGRLVTPGGRAPIEVYQKAPDRFLVVIDSPVSGVSRNGYDGSVAWSRNRQAGLREMSGPEVENFKREYHLHREVKLGAMYPGKAVRGMERLGEREAFVVDATAPDETSETMYFDAGTGLLVRRDVTLEGATIQALFQDYKEVDGLMVPFTIQRSRSDFSFTHRFDRVEHDVPIDDAMLRKPAGP